MPTERDISGWLRQIVDHGQDVELRALKVRKPGSKKLVTITKHFHADQLDQMAREALRLSGLAAGVYFIPNPVRLPLGNDSKGRRRTSASDDDIIARTRLLIDCDPVRHPAEISATDDEKAAALAKAAEIREFLRARGWPDPIEADSGNGAHLVQAIDLPHNDASKELCKAVLAALAARFTSPAVKIDTMVFNASRVYKLYGTMACKGQPSADRPHRVSRVLKVPDAFTPVDRDQLAALVAELTPAEASAPPPATCPGTRPRPHSESDSPSGDRTTISLRDRRDRAAAYLESCEPAISGEKGHNKLFKIACNIGPGLDLPPDEALALLRDIYNPRCDPPWTDGELRHKVDDAYRLETRPRGFKLDALRTRSNGRARPGSDDPPASGATTNGRPPDVPDRPGGRPPREGKPNETEDDPHRLARIFVRNRAHHIDGPTLRYWQGEWQRWDGAAYRGCTDEEVRAEVTGVIKDEFDRLNLIALRLHDDKAKPPPTVRPVTTKLVSNVIQALRGITLLGARECPSQPAWIDREEPFPAVEVVPTRNALVHIPGLIDGRGRRAVLAPTPRFFCPYALDYDFVANAPEPENWLTFLGEKPVGPDSGVKHQLWPNDPQSRDTLQEWYGLNLVPDTRYQKIGAIIGPRRCGKGTIARVLTGVVGPENVANPTLSTLGTLFGLSPLIGKLSAIISDARLSGRTDIAQVVENLLSLSGEDGRTIDRKHLQAWTGRLVARFTLISNEIPRLADSSGALPGRMVLLRLTRSFYGQEDEGLMEKLMPERAGILLWAIEGLKRLRRRGRFIQPDSGRPLVEEMEELSSPIGTFVKECCVVGPNCHVPVPELFKLWMEHCKEKNREASAGDEAAFGRNLRSVVPELETKPSRRAGKFIRIFHGIDKAGDPTAF